MADLDRRQQIADYARALPLAHRVVIVAAVAVIGLSGFLFFRWVSQPSWTVVASGIDPEDVAEVIEALDNAGISSRVQEGPTRIEVPRSDRFAANAALEEAGVVSPGDLGGLMGNEILDSQGLSVTDALQRENIRRALEGELSRTLAAMDFVRSARVSLVSPEPALFAEDELPVQASVALDLTTRPTGEDVDAVVLFVAGAVEGLEPDQVTVVDTEGNVWSAPNTGSGMASVRGDNWSFKTQVESSLEARIAGLLDGLEVRGDAVVTAEVNFDETTIESLTYDPESGVQIRRQLQEEDMAGVNTDAGGVPGVDGGAIEVGEGGEFTYSNRIENLEQGFNSVETITVVASGVIETVNVAIAIDDGSISGEPVPAPEQVLRLVTAGLGLDVEAGDQVAVEAFPLAAADDDADLVTAAGGGMDIFALVAQAIGALAFLGVIAALFILARRRPEEDEEEVVLEAEDDTRELGRGMPELDAADLEAAQIRSDVVDLVRNKPDEMAGLLRGWLNER
ncbi:MAG: flagellar M-ring protein FliF C-terminal domain-containing protein [Actinomycetota bacterium]